MFYTIIFTQYEQTCKSVILYKLKSKKITVEHSGVFWCDRICYCSLTQTFLNEVNYEVAISITNINIQSKMNHFGLWFYVFTIWSPSFLVHIFTNIKQYKLAHTSTKLISTVHQRNEAWQYLSLLIKFY